MDEKVLLALFRAAWDRKDRAALLQLSDRYAGEGGEFDRFARLLRKLAGQQEKAAKVKRPQRTWDYGGLRVRALHFTHPSGCDWEVGERLVVECDPLPSGDFIDRYAAELWYAHQVTGYGITDSFSVRYWCVAVCDTMSPPLYVVEEGSEVAALDLFLSENDSCLILPPDRNDYLEDPPDPQSDYRDDVYYDPSGNPCDISNLTMREVKLVHVELY